MAIYHAPGNCDEMQRQLALDITPGLNETIRKALLAKTYGYAKMTAAMIHAYHWHGEQSDEYAGTAHVVTQMWHDLESYVKEMVG
jgi:anthranilate phosphoribosyltransferase